MRGTATTPATTPGTGGRADDRTGFRSAAAAAATERALRRRFRGPVHVPGDAAYETARATPHGTVDPGPALVAEALGAADVQAAVRAAREHGLPFAVQATGHGTLVPSDGGLLVSTSRMSAVLVDPARRVARVGPGARWSDVIAAAAPFGLAPLSGTSPSVGVAGYTLGGGVGWLSRRYGFAADSLLRAELVTADGRLMTASPDRHPDLFWALRGGGGNFGVATSLELRLYPVDRAYGGVVYFPVDRAVDLLAYYRDWAPEQPDELTTTVVVTRSAPGADPGGPVVAVRGFFAGEAAAAERALRPLWRVAGTPVSGGFRPMTYADSGTIGGTPPLRFDLFDRLPDAAVDAVVAAAGRDDALAAAMEVRYWGGAMARPDADAGPVGHRDVPFSVTVFGPPAAAAPLAPYATGGSFLNFLGDPARTHTAYTAENYARLREVKRAYDPDNVLGPTHNIPPSPIRLPGHTPDRQPYLEAR